MYGKTVIGEINVANTVSYINSIMKTIRKIYCKSSL